MAPLGPPILSPRMPFPGLAQLSCPPFPHPIALTTLCPQEKDFNWGRGPASLPLQPPVVGSVLSLVMWWQPVGGLSGHRPLCAQPDLAAWYEAQLLPDSHPEGKGKALEGLGGGRRGLSILAAFQCPTCQMLAAAPQVGWCSWHGVLGGW